MSKPTNKALMTSHAKHQLATRFVGIVSFLDVVRAVNSYGDFEVGQTYVCVAKLSEKITVFDGCKYTTGDVIYAVVDKRDASDPGRIPTVLVRNNTAADRSYRSYDAIKQTHTVWKK